MFSFNATMLSERLIEVFNTRKIRSYMEPLAPSFTRLDLRDESARPLGRAGFEALHAIIFSGSDGSHHREKVSDIFIISNVEMTEYFTIFNIN